MYWVAGGMGVLPWYVAILLYMKDGGPDFGNCHANFAIVDGVSLLTTMLLHLYLCELPGRQILRTAGLSVLVSPSLAVSLAFAAVDRIGFGT